MATAVLDPPATQAELRSFAGGLEVKVEEALALEQPPAAAAEVAERLAERQRWFADFRSRILAATKSEIWQGHDLKNELLWTLEELRDAIDADPDGTDPELREREALMRMRVVLQAMGRQIEHVAIDQPEVAAEFVAEALEDVGDQEIADLLDTTPRMIAKYRQGVTEIRKDPDRAVLIGQLVYELKGSRTPRGVLMWFEAEREQLGGRSPRQLIEADARAAHEPLIRLARGGRGQLDSGTSGPLD